MIKAVIFDVDGTLVDSNGAHAEAWHRAFAEYGHEIPVEEIRRQIGKGGDQLMPVFLKEEEVAGVGKKIEEERGEIFKEEYLPRVPVFPKVRELFQKLKADGTEILLGSSGKKEELEVYQERAGITELVDGMTTADDAEKSKPHPDIFDAALEKLEGTPREAVLVVGDSPYDVEAAGKAGLRTVGLLCGGFSKEELLRAGARAVYGDVAELLARYPEWMTG